MGVYMRLRNKKTGEIVDLAKGGLLKSDNDNHIIVYPEGTLKYYAYNSLAELNEEWEDYEPKEPLIKDEKIRRAVRAWAEVNRTKYVWVSTALKGIDITQDFEHLQLTEYKQNITFECEADFKSGNYTIAELCGEDKDETTQ